MSSPSREARVDGVDADVESGPTEGTVGPLLDGAFGLFVWMAHLLVVYVLAALACGLGLVAPGGGRPTGLVTALVLATAVAAVVVALHALRRWRQQRALPDRRFRMAVTLGGDAIATVAIVWQLLAVALVPACA